MKKLFHFFFSHSIFIAICAVGLCYETNIVLGIKVNIYLLAFVFFSTITAYNFYWILSKYYFSINVKGFLKNNASFFLVALVGALGTLFFFQIQPLNFTVVYISFLLTLLYSAPLWPFPSFKKLQQFGFLKTILLSFSWAFVTCVLPVSNEALLSSNKFLLFFVSRFSFMLILCFIFDKRDEKIDKMHGLHTLATDINRNADKKIFFFFLLCYLISACSFFYLQKETEQFFSTLIISVLLYYTYRRSLKTQGYLFYYFWVDGMMLISVFINLLFKNL
jgi:hypothetical protein